MQAVISLCFLFRGLPAANRGAEILGNLAKREIEAAAKPAGESVPGPQRCG